MQGQHDGHGSLVVDGHDTGHDSGRAERDQALTSPSSSSAPTGAATPESQLDRTSRYGAGPAARGRARSAGLVELDATRTWGCPPGTCRGPRCARARRRPARRAHARPSRCRGRASPLPGTAQRSCATSAPSVISPGPTTRATRRGPGPARARGQVSADGATVTARSCSDGMSVHGTACNRPAGPTTTGPSPEVRRRGAQQQGLQLGAPVGQQRSSPDCGGAWRQAAQQEAAHLDLVVGIAAHRVQAHPPTATVITCSTPSTSTSSIRLRPAEFAEELIEIELSGLPARAARRPAGARLHRLLEPPPLTLQGVRRGRISPPPSSRITLRSAPSSAASSRSCTERRAPGGQRGRPPPLAPEQQPADVAPPERVALGQHGQLGAVRRPVRRAARSRRGVIWCSSRASSPRAQAATVARALPRASACSARASQATLRVSGGPRRRDLAARSRCWSASARRPRLSASRPASRCAWIASSARAASMRAAICSAYRSRLADARRPRTGPGRGRGRRAPPRRSAPAPGTAGAPDAPVPSRSAGSPAARAAVAAAKSSSAFLYAFPPRGGIRLSAVSRLPRRFFGEPGGQQRRAAVDGEVGVGLAERVVPIPGLVEVGKRLGQVAAGQRHQPAVVAGMAYSSSCPVPAYSSSARAKSAAARPGRPSPRKTTARQVSDRASHTVSPARRK